MSYTIWLEIDAGGPTPIVIGDWNYTSNIGPMLHAAGLDLDACAGREAGEVAESIAAALQRLQADPARFQAYNPRNGWGSYDTILHALQELQHLCESAPRGRVGVSS